MFLAANPDKGKTAEEKGDLKKKYEPGEDVMPKVEQSEKTLRERRAEDEDRRLLNEVRDLSLREVGVGSADARTARRRRDDERLGSAAPRSRGEASRGSRSADEREHRRRHETSGEGRRRRRDEPIPSGSSLAPAEENRPRRGQEDTERSHEQTGRSAARRIEHQSSLRSLISSSEVDSHEMEEEILRQIQEEGLLDGIDLEHIDVNQEDQISERIADAFRRRQREKSRAEPVRPRDVSPAIRNAQPTSRGHSDAGGLRASSRRRTNSQSASTGGQVDEQIRPTPHTSSAHLEIESAGENRRRRRTTSSGRGATVPVLTPNSESTRPAARSQTDLSDRPRSSQTPPERSQPTAHSRSTSQPTPERQAEAPTGLLAAEESEQLPSLDSGVRVPERTQGPSVLSELPTTTGSAPLTAASVLTLEPSAARSPAQSSLVPTQLSPRDHKTPSSLERAISIQSGSRPTSSSSAGSRTHLPRFPEPFLTCARCAKPHIEYELHYNCSQCHNGDWNICLSCYRDGRGCLHWFGFGHAAWARWERLKSSGEPPQNLERPHMLNASRYLPPKMSPGGADGRRTITSEDPQRRLQSGVFCTNCLAWANECYWRCDICNEGDWGFCNTCVNQGKCCTHPLLPLTYKPEESSTPPISPTHNQQAPPSATLLTGPGVVEFGPFKPLTFRVTCDICHHVIQPSSSRYHCFFCTSSLPGRQPGDYDICSKCYNALESKKRISRENGQNGWRRCLQGHRSIIVGFEDTRGGQCRIIIQDLVGGRGLHEEPLKSVEHLGQDLQQWSWAKGSQVRLVTTDVSATAPTTSTSLSLATKFPLVGDSGMRALALWSWYPKEGDGGDELLFPRGAEVRECVDVNGDWFWGVYMGAEGLFPAPYVRVLDESRH